MTSAAARRSSIRPLVHEPTKTVSTAMSRSGVPGGQPHVLQAPLGGDRARRLVGEVLRVRARTAESGTPWPGLVPQVTNGVSVGASRTTSSSKLGVVVGDQRAASTRRRRPSRRPAGACGRPSR